MRLAVVGASYYGLSISVWLSQNNYVELVDFVPSIVEKINLRISPYTDDYLDKYFKEIPLGLHATLDAASAFRDADMLIIAVPTYESGFFDSSLMDRIIKLVSSVNPNVTVVIKSKMPTGYIDTIKKEYNINKILVNPEPSGGLYNYLYPSRIIVGCDGGNKIIAEEYADLLKENSLKENVLVQYTELE